MKSENISIEKIHNDRVSLTQQIGWLFRPLALCPFPAQYLKKRIVVESTGKQKEEHAVLWSRKSSEYEVEIVAHPKYGVPYGADILIVLFLAIEARKQKSRKIMVNFYRDFMRMFGMSPDSGRKYKLVVNSLQRIKNAKYNWSYIGDERRQKDFHYLYIEECDLYCDPKTPDQKPIFDQYILLSERFWYEINQHKIPFNLDAIKCLKSKPAHLNFYLWISTRTGQMYVKMKQENTDEIKVFIPFWGEYGLVNQLSTQIKKRNDFRVQVKRWIKTTKEIWPKCPVEIEGDGLKIIIKDLKQLDVHPDLKQELGKAIRQAEKKKIETKKQICPDCKKTLIMVPGKYYADGRKKDDYLFCKNCSKPFFKHLHPELYKKNHQLVL
jgi:hypothetical protein